MRNRRHNPLRSKFKFQKPKLKMQWENKRNSNSKLCRFPVFKKCYVYKDMKNESRFTLLWMKKINIYVKILLLCCCRCIQIQIKLLGHPPQNCYLCVGVTLLHSMISLQMKAEFECNFVCLWRFVCSVIEFPQIANFLT